MNVPSRLSLNQFSVGQAILSYQREQGVPEQVRILAVVEAEGELVKIGVQVLGRELVVGADQRPLEEAPYALYGVRVNVRSYPLFRSVVNGLVLAASLVDAFVAKMLVGVDLGTLIIIKKK